MAWSNVDEIDEDALYKMSFGDIANKSIYEDGMNNVFTKAEGTDLVMHDGSSTLAKAVNVGTTSSSAAGGVSAFVPIIWDTDVIDITRKMTPLLTLLPKVTNKGTYAQYYRITARADAAWEVEDPAITPVDDTRVEASEQIKYLRTSGRVTGVAQVAGAHFESSMQREVLNKTQSMNEMIEHTILRGDAAADPLQHDGLEKILTSNSSDQAGAITLSAVRKLVSDCFVDKGAPNLLITDPYTADDLVEQSMDFVRYVDPNITIAWGLQVPSIQTVVGRIPVLVSQFMNNTSGSRRLFCINTNYVQQRVLQDITFERMAKTSDSEKFLLKSYRCLINKFPEGMGQLYGITD